jgi:hypothetical protein
MRDVVVPSVLNVVVRAPPAKMLGDSRPIWSVISVELANQRIFFRCPRCLDEIRVEIVLEAFTTLATGLAGDQFSNFVPIGIRLGANRSQDALIVFGTEVLAILLRLEE